MCSLYKKINSEQFLVLKNLSYYENKTLNPITSHLLLSQSKKLLYIPDFRGFYVFVIDHTRWFYRPFVFCD